MREPNRSQVWVWITTVADRCRRINRYYPVGFDASSSPRRPRRASRRSSSPHPRPSRCINLPLPDRQYRTETSWNWARMINERRKVFGIFSVCCRQPPFASPTQPHLLRFVGDPHPFPPPPQTPAEPFEGAHRGSKISSRRSRIGRRGADLTRSNTSTMDD